jgi:hypothetical protein
MPDTFRLFDVFLGIPVFRPSLLSSSFCLLMVGTCMNILPSWERRFGKVGAVPKRLG